MNFIKNYSTLELLRQHPLYQDTGGDYHQGNVSNKMLPEHVDSTSSTSHRNLCPGPNTGQTVQLRLVHLRLDVRSLGPEIKTLDSSLPTGSQQVVVVNLVKVGDKLVKPLVGHDGGVPRPRVPHLHKPVLVPSHGDVRIKTEAGVQGRVMTLDKLGPKQIIIKVEIDD